MRGERTEARRCRTGSRSRDAVLEQAWAKGTVARPLERAALARGPVAAPSPSFPGRHHGDPAIPLECGGEQETGRGKGRGGRGAGQAPAVIFLTGSGSPGRAPLLCCHRRLLDRERRRGEWIRVLGRSRPVPGFDPATMKVSRRI
jgi:hypothetical protein